MFTVAAYLFETMAKTDNYNLNISDHSHIRFDHRKKLSCMNLHDSLYPRLQPFFNSK